MDWIQLTSVSQLEEINTSSSVSVIFKHSTRCSISRFVLKNFENDCTSDGSTQYYFLDILTYRDISNTIAAMYGVEHQSPQVLFIKGGECVYTSSHEQIEFSEILQLN